MKKALTFKEAAVYLGISESTLYKKTAAKEIPTSKPGGKKIYIDREWLDSYMLSCMSKSSAEIESQAATYLATK